MKSVKNAALKERLMSVTGYQKQFSFDAEAHTRLLWVAPGEYIIREGRAAEYLFYLAQGRAKLYVTMSNGRVPIIDFFTAPCFIGEMELVEESLEACAVQAIEDCYCLALPLASCKTLLLNDTLFLRKLCAYLSWKNYRNIMYSTQNQSFPLASRLAAFILMSENSNIYQEKHTQVAEHLGVSYRHLLYVLAGFVDDGLIEKQGRAYCILRRDGLQALADEMGEQAY